MEVRETMQSPPFWASPSTSNASSSSPSSSYSNSRSTHSGIKPWIIVLLFSIVLLFFLPSILSTPFQNTRSSLSIKSGWDVLNLCLVAFAILCGVLSRIGDGSGSKSVPDKQPWGGWTGFSNPTVVEMNRTAGMRQMRSSSSYPDLRMDTDVWGQNRVPDSDSWRFFDDAELYQSYRNRRMAQLYQIPVSGEEERECKTIQVDTERFPPMEEVEKEGKVESETASEEEKGREAMVVRQRRSLEALPKMEEVEKEPMVVVGRRRRRSLERFPLIEEVEKETKFEEVEEQKVKRPQMVVRRRRKSSGSFPQMDEIEKEAQVEEGEMVEKPSEAVARRRQESSEKLPEIEEVEKPPMVAEATPPPPPPPPPPPETKVVVECRKHRKSGSGGGAKDLASAIALFYQKKTKGNKSKKKEKHEISIEANSDCNSTTESNSNPSTAPPPPPPPPPRPPPASIFYQLFSNKKGGSKSRRIHSFSTSTHSNSSTTNAVITPPPPPPQEGLNRFKKHQISSSSGYRRIEDSELSVHRRRSERSNLSPYANYPLPPRSPLPPAPPPPPPAPPVCANVAESRAEEKQTNGTMAVSCASPDVNDKADLFIKRFRAGLTLEKINSIKEKEKGKGREG